MKMRAVLNSMAALGFVGAILWAVSPALAAEPPKPGGRLAAFEIHASPKDAPALSFTNEAGEELGLDDWKGKAVLLNLWATWCAPCKHEMPQLDNLQAMLGSDTFEVVAVSLDRSGLQKPKRFYTRAGIENLGLYNDKSMRLGATLGATGMPTTVLFDSQGREIGRLTGPAVWDSPEAVTFIRELAGLAGEG